MNTPRAVALTSLVVLAVVALRAQPQPTAPLTFEVVSIRRNTSLSTGGGGGPKPGGRYTYTNVPARTLIVIAYGLPRVLGGPGWITTERYDINAIGKENPTSDETAQMFKALLRDRFNLAVHLEKRDFPVYSLVLARRDGQLGPGMRRSTVDCNDPQARKAASSSQSRMVCGFTTEQGDFTGGGLTMSTLAGILATPSGRPVLDRTGLTGAFDVELRWTPTLQPDATTADVLSVFTAVQEQLGLKLEADRTPLDVVVVDRIQRPAPN